MESIPQDRVVVYLDPDLSRRLRLEKAESRNSISSIVNQIIRVHYQEMDRGRIRMPPLPPSPDRSV